MEEIVIKRREIFFNNLILLGLDKIILEKKHGITFHKDMFVLPNKKGFEIVTYFLFSKLNSVTGKDYNIPWPLVSKDHDRAFQKACYSHLMNFSQENCIKFPRIVASLLSTFGGDRFYEVFLAFSSYVLYKTVKKNGNITLLSQPVVSPENFNIASEILLLSTVSNMEKFRDTQIMAYHNHKVLVNFAKTLEDSLRKLKVLLKSNDEAKRKKINSILSLYSVTLDGNFSVAKITELCCEYLNPFLKRRKILDEFFSSEEKYWQYLCTEIGESAESECLNGQDYQIQVADFIPEEYVKELKSAGCLSSHENGKLSVERFIKIFEAYLTFTVDLLKKANLQGLHKACIVENASAIEDDLNCIRNLNEKLSEVIPCVKKNIEELKHINDLDNTQEDLEESCDQLYSLPVLSFDTEAVQQRTSHFDTSLEKLFHSSSKKQLQNTSIDTDEVFLSEKSKISFTSSLDQTVTSQSSSSVTSALFTNMLFVNSSKSTGGSMNDRKSDVLAANSLSSDKVSIPSLEDLDLSCTTTQFKIRPSWQAEESLFSVSLPDASFVD